MMKQQQDEIDPFDFMEDDNEHGCYDTFGCTTTTTRTETMKSSCSSSSSSAGMANRISINNNNGQNLHLPQIRTSNHPLDDNIIVRELNDLTFEEREKVYEEVHGVVMRAGAGGGGGAHYREETTEFVETCLSKLQNEISNLSRRKRRELDKAFFMKPALQYDKTFLMMFLRADNYDAYWAAQRMASYFTRKSELFGEGKLVKTITLDDMSKDDMECVREGGVHVLPQKDQAGRTVMYSNVRLFKYKHWKNLTRYVWYQIMCALEDEATQIHGIVNISDCVGLTEMKTDVSDYLSNSSPILGDLPLRFAAMHFCYNDARFKPALSLVQVVITRYIRLRFRVHFGSSMECLYAIMTFGIPRDAIPIHPDGNPVEGIHEKYLAFRKSLEAEREQDLERQREERKEKEKLHDTPKPQDVLLGRGRAFFEYPGNQQLSCFVDAERHRYDKMNRSEKTHLSKVTVEKVWSTGGRFLQKTEQGWQEVDDIIARDKVSQAFRSKPTRSASNTVAGVAEVLGVGYSTSSNDMIISAPVNTSFDFRDSKRFRYN